MITVVIPYIDCLPYTTAALDDALNQSAETRVLLIDQGSSNQGRAWGDEQQLRYEGRVLCWHFDPALSLGAAWNRAMQFVCGIGESGALVINNDIRMHKYTAEYLRDLAEHHQAYFVSGVGINDEEKFEAFAATEFSRFDEIV